MRLFQSLAVIVILFSSITCAFALGAGDSAVVNWKGSYYNATILKQNAANSFIRYTGYDSSWDEWVTPKRMRIQVLWKGKWYDARALDVSGSRVFITYKGYGSEWDEWVKLDRIRSR